MMFSQKQLKRSGEVLMQLDNCNSNFVFPFLDNGNVYLADTRMSVYANSSNWAIIIEVVGCNPRAWQTDGFDNCLYCYGKPLTKRPGIDNDNFLFPIGNGASDALFKKDESEIINPSATDLKISGNIVSIINDPLIYSGNGITLREPPSICAFELLRLLSVTHRNLLLATEVELAVRMSKPIPMILRLDEWYHPDIANGEKPSENETFKQIARVIEALDTNLYNPSMSPNTHWSNWPNGGTL